MRSTGVIVWLLTLERVHGRVHRCLQRGLDDFVALDDKAAELVANSIGAAFAATAVHAVLLALVESSTLWAARDHPQHGPHARLRQHVAYLGCAVE